LLGQNPKTSKSSVFTKNFIKYEIPKDIIETVIYDAKRELRGEINTDLQTRINETILSHPSAINVTQIQKVPEILGDKIYDELNEMKFLLSKLSGKTDNTEKNLNDQFKRIPAIESNISSIKTEVLNKASREEFQSIQLALPNLITKQDYEK